MEGVKVYFYYVKPHSFLMGGSSELRQLPPRINSENLVSTASVLATISLVGLETSEEDTHLVPQLTTLP